MGQHSWLDTFIIGAGTGAGMALLVAIFEWARRKITGERAPEPLTREDIIERLEAIIADPATSPDLLDQASSRLRELEEQDRAKGSWLDS